MDVTNSATSNVVMEVLRTSFAQYGIPETIVTANGSCFVSEEIEVFTRPMESNTLHQLYTNQFLMALKNVLCRF